MLSSLLSPHFCKSAFFCFAWGGKRLKESTKKQKDQFNFFFAWFLFLISKWFCLQKKKQFVCWELCFLVNEKYKVKKSFSFVHKITFWLLVRKNKSKCWTSVVLRLVLKERAKTNQAFCFFLLALLWCPNKKKEVFFEVAFCSYKSYF